MKKPEHHLPLKPFMEKKVSEHEETVFSVMDKIFQAHLAEWTLGISPAALTTSQYSWLAQLGQSPGTLAYLSLFPLLKWQEFQQNLTNKARPGKGREVRFHSEDWAEMPWKLWAELFLLLEDWSMASTDMPGLPPHVKRTIGFRQRQILDAISPSNFVFSNPDLFKETLRSGGVNLIRGTQLAVQDMLEKITGTPPAGSENFIPGKQVAITPGKVVYRNHLIELIQYKAETTQVYKEPILIIPAWIMKYYILDLQPENSLVKWLVKQGHTVFIISWRNPDEKDRNLSMDDYYRMGAMDAIDAVNKARPNTPIHLMGYCLGGTLAMITAAAMAKNKDYRLKSLSLLASQGDFSEAGELLLFITKSEVTFLNNMMWEKGYLDTVHMAGSFQMLRSYDLIWSKMVQDYMHGTQRGLIALLAWNADATRMPYKMHSEYLEKLFLNNDFSQGRYSIEGDPIAPADIRLPTFAVSTEMDHVAPWRSVYKTHLLLNSDVTFVLTNGGHNAGIVSEPGHPGRRFLIHSSKNTEPFITPDDWVEIAEPREGSWWLAWHQWLVEHSSPVKIKAPKLKASLPDAPGDYVLQK